MNPIIKAQLDEFKNSNSGESLKDHEFFEVMSIYSIENGILGENIDPFSAHLKGDEFGVDGIAVLVQGELCVDSDQVESVLSVGKNHSSAFHFFQSKTSTSVDYGDVSKFLDGVYDFFAGPTLLKGTQIEDLALARDKVFASSARSNPELRCYFCTTGSGDVQEPVAKLIESNRDRLEQLNAFSSITIECLGAKSIQAGFRSATKSISQTISFSKSVALPTHSKVDQAYIGYVSADQVLGMILGPPDQNGVRHVNRSVFYDNVRDFNPDSEINKSILSDISSGEHDSFIFKNNGITVVAKSISRKNDDFRLDDFQIVNGCQTANILSLVAEDAAKITVPIRIISSSDPDFVSKIIVGTNKQNQVSDDQFWALLPFMKDLEVYCAAQSDEQKLFIERRENQYRDSHVERTRVIRPRDLMKVAVAMFYDQPNRAARDHRGIRKEYGSELFKEQHSIELYHVAALASYKFDYLVRTGRIERSRSLYKFYALCSLVREAFPKHSILNASKKDRDRICAKIITEVLDNDAFSSQVDAVSLKIERMLPDGQGRTREQLRDFIRTDGFRERFIASFS